MARAKGKPKPTKDDPTAQGYYCGAKKRSGGNCERVAGAGTNHKGVGTCSNHLGSTDRAEVAGQVFLAKREAMVMGVPLNIEPHEAILECIRIAAGEVAYASERIAALQAGEAVGPVVSRTDRPLKEEKGAESPDYRVEEIREDSPDLHIWIKVRHLAMDRLVQYSAVAIKAGIEERRVQLAESQGQLLVTVIRGVLEQVERLVDRKIMSRPELPTIVREQLTLAAPSLHLAA
jgi:hypothetical protein